mgnify:CR=1 FL=1
MCRKTKNSQALQSRRMITEALLRLMKKEPYNGFSETPAELSLIAQHFFSETDPLYNQSGPHKF